MPKAQNPQVFLDISIGGGPADKITFELFSDVVPNTAENFRALCTGERGIGVSTQKPLHFKGSDIHRIVKGFVAQGGDFSTGDGRGGESIYGGNFPDENFKLKHDQPGVLSMANSGRNSNGSQFFLTFKALPHLNGKHVVFGKAVNGMALLKKLEEIGSDDGKPIRQVKIVDCGEVSNTKTRSQLREKDKKLKRSEDNSDGEGRFKAKRRASDEKRTKKRKYSSSSDSYSLDTSDSRSYSSDSRSDSESYSDSSSSSGYRHKRRRKGSKKDKCKSAKRKSDNRRTKRRSRRTDRKSKWSSGSSSDDSKSSNSSSGSSDTESGDHQTKHSLQKGRAKAESTIINKDRSMEDATKDKQKATTVNTSQDGNRLSDKNDGMDGTNQSSEPTPNKFREEPGTISRDTLDKSGANLTMPQNTDGASGAGPANAGISQLGTERNPPSNEPAPAPTNSKGLVIGSATNGQSQRVRKGRGFTQQYAFARRYRTPSPERSPVRSRYYGGRNERGNYFNRYGRNEPYRARSPVRRYRGSPRASSPSRYPRRGRSRSRSRSPVSRRDRGGYRRPSPRRSHSPTEQRRRDVGDMARPSRGGSSPPVDKGRPRSRSKSSGPSTPRSPYAAPLKRESTRYNRRRSSSSRSSSPAGSKGLVSY